MPDLTDDEVRPLFSDFEREISTWPRPQATIALDVLDAVMNGDKHTSVASTANNGLTVRTTTTQEQW
jgi:hypothetical protein